MTSETSAGQGEPPATESATAAPAHEIAPASDKDALPVIDAPSLAVAPSELGATSSEREALLDATRIAREAPPMPTAVDTPAAAALAGRDEPKTAKPRASRFALLAASVALCATLGAVGGSAGITALAQLMSAPQVTHPDPTDDIRVLKEAVTQLRSSLKAVGDNVAAIRAGATASNAAVSAQLAKLGEEIERMERGQGEHHAVATPPPTDVTGTVAVSAQKPAIVEGWVVRRVYDGTALVEGRYGIIEIEPGDHLPGVGRIQEIKRQDGRWVVVTPKGLIVSAR